MSSSSTNSYFISLLLHGAVAALILFCAYLSSDSSSEVPKVFELVAGAGDNYGATAAPALGAPDGVKVNLPAELQPAAPAPASTPAPEAPVAPAPTPREESPPIQAAPVTAPAPVKAKAKADAVPNFTKTLRHTENRRVKRIMDKYKKGLEAEDRRERLSYEQYLKEHAGKSGATAEGIRDGVAGGSTSNKTGGAGGKALTREQGELLDAYFALLKARIHENHVPPPDVSDQLKARVEFNIAADGTLSHVRIVESSGNSAFDESVLEAFSHTHSIGPRPDHRSETGLTLEFRLQEDNE